LENTDSGQQVVEDDYLYGWMAISQLMAAGGSLSGREANCCYLNVPGGPFANVSSLSGLDFIDDGRTINVVDWDQDGALDLWLANRTGPRLRFLRNTTSAAGRFLTLQLQGVQSNRDAIGARVELYTESASQRPAQIRTLRAGEGYLGQSSKSIHFGLPAAVGQTPHIDRVVVRWPGGDAETYADLKPGNRYRLVQGSGRPVAIPPRTLAPQLVAQRVEMTTTTQNARIILAGRLAMPPLTYTTAQGSQAPIPVGKNRLLLVNLWAPWCLPCVKELAEFAKAKAELDPLDLDVLAVCVDEKVEPREWQQTLERLKWPMLAGSAEGELLDVLDILQRVVTSLRKPVPIPTSFLVDRQGRLAAIYKGPVSVDQLIGDIQQLDGADDDQTIRASIPFAGRWLREPQPDVLTTNEVMFELLNAGYTKQAEAYVVELAKTGAGTQRGRQSLAVAHLNLGARYLGARQQAEAQRAFQTALRYDPDLTKAHLGLARVLLQLKRPAEAMPHMLAVVKAETGHADMHFELGMQYTSQGQAVEAIRHLKAAAAERPDWVAPLNILARVLALHPDPTIGNLGQARQLASRAVELTGRRDPQSLETLAVVAWRSGDLTEAISVGEEAIRVAPAENRALAARLRQQVQSWRAQQKP
jgi:tetratricopeptide (TPR) repeat protein